MTVTINGTTGIDKVQDGSIQAADLASGVPSRSQLPAGTVLQVVYGSYNTENVVNSSTAVDTGLTATITPTSATSKILIIVNHQYLVQTINQLISFNVVRQSTTITTAPRSGYVGGSTPMAGSFTQSYLDSPTSTSTLTYKTQVYKDSASGSGVVMQWNNQSPSTITLMEIAA